MEMRMVIDGDSAFVLIACPECGSTGLYQGFAEPEGVGVICLKCNGSGGRWIAFRPFAGRQVCDDVTTVAFSRGALIALGVGPDENRPPMTYEEFLATFATEPAAPTA
jgi:hypothetical protein